MFIKNMFNVAFCTLPTGEGWETQEYKEMAKIDDCSLTMNIKECGLKYFGISQEMLQNDKVQHERIIGLFGAKTFTAYFPANSTITEGKTKMCKSCYENTLAYAEWIKIAFDNDEVHEVTCNNHTFQSAFHANLGNQRIFIPMINNTLLCFTQQDFPESSQVIENNSYFPFFTIEPNDPSFKTVFFRFNKTESDENKIQFNMNTLTQGRAFFSTSAAHDFLKVEEFLDFVKKNDNFKSGDTNPFKIQKVDRNDKMYMKLKKSVLNTYIFEKEYLPSCLDQIISRNNINININMDIYKFETVKYESDISKNSESETKKVEEKKYPIIICIVVSVLFIFGIIVQIIYYFYKRSKKV